MDEGSAGNIETQVRRFLEDERSIVDIDYRDVLKSFGIEGDSFFAIEECFSQITDSEIFKQSWFKDSIIAMKLLTRFVLIFPSLKFTTAPGYDKVTGSLAVGTRNTITEIFLRRGLRFKIYKDSDDGVDRAKVDSFYHQLISNIQNLPEIIPKVSDFKRLQKRFMIHIYSCYLGDQSIEHAKRRRINEVSGIGSFEKSHLDPLAAILQIFRLSKDKNYSCKPTIELYRENLIPAECKIGKGGKTIYLKPDVTIETTTALIPVEFKCFNSEKLFLELSGTVENDLLNQLTLYMLFGNTAVGILCDGYNISIVEFEFKRRILYSKDEKRNRIINLPIKVNVFNIEDKYAMVKMALMIDEVIANQSSVIESNIKAYKDILLKNSKEICQVLKERAEEFVFLELLNQSSDFSFDEVHYTGNDYDEIQAGFVFNSQTLGFTLGQVETIFGRTIATTRKPKHEIKVVLKIYDPIRRLFTEDQDKLKEYDILGNIQKSKKAELDIYQRIQNFNESSDSNENKINIPIIFANGYVKLEFKDDYFCGGYIVMERLFGKPTKAEHFVKARKQLDLLHKIGIYHGDIKLPNTFFHKGKFYFIDFGFSYLSGKPNHKYNSPSQRSSRADLDDLETLEKQVLGTTA